MSEKMFQVFAMTKSMHKTQILQQSNLEHKAEQEYLY